jgi:hypothetical protein
MKNLELIVDEPIRAHYYWTLVQMGGLGEAPVIIDYARGPMPSHASATAAGVVAMRQIQQAEASARASTMRPGMRTEWVVETVPARLA